MFKALLYKNGIAQAIIVLETLFLELIWAPNGRLIALKDQKQLFFNRIA
jgi:hypothetical protein